MKRCKYLVWKRGRMLRNFVSWCPLGKSHSFLAASSSVGGKNSHYSARKKKCIRPNSCTLLWHVNYTDVIILALTYRSETSAFHQKVEVEAANYSSSIDKELHFFHTFQKELLPFVEIISKMSLINFFSLKCYPSKRIHTLPLAIYLGEGRAALETLDSVYWMEIEKVRTRHTDNKEAPYPALSSSIVTSFPTTTRDCTYCTNHNSSSHTPAGLLRYPVATAKLQVVGSIMAEVAAFQWGRNAKTLVCSDVGAP